MSRKIEFWVAGSPVAQGSMRAFNVGGKARVTHAKPGPLMFWRQRIATEAQAIMGEAPLMAEPVFVAAHFNLPRPQSRPKKYQFPDRQPDIDKLERALLDALTGVVIDDDKRVVWTAMRKAYAGSEFGCSETPGVKVFVETLD